MEAEAENSSGNSSMYSDVKLQELNDEEVKVNIGAIVFISILMILGLLGNISTIFIYLKKYKPSTYRTFILCLAIVNLATCCLSMPFSMIILRFPLMFSYDEMCKGFKFLTFSLCSGSTLILVTIAVDRYRKICVPHGAQLSIRMARYICILDFLLASVFSSPCIVLFGNKHYETPLHNMSGTGCYYSDEFWNTSYPVKYNYFLLSTLLVTFVALLVIYGLIGKQILHINRKRHPNQQMQLSVQKVTRKLYTNKNYRPSESQGNVVSQYDVNEKTEVSVYFTSLFDLTDIKERQSPCEPYQTFYPQKEDDSLARSTLKRRRSNTVILILLIVTVISFISFLPNLFLTIIALERKDFLPNLSFTEMAAYQIFSWSFYINSVTFPIIYGFCDAKFIKETRKLFSLCVFLCFRRR